MNGIIIFLCLFTPYILAASVRDWKIEAAESVKERKYDSLTSFLIHEIRGNSTMTRRGGKERFIPPIHCIIMFMTLYEYGPTILSYVYNYVGFYFGFGSWPTGSGNSGGNNQPQNPCPDHNLCIDQCTNSKERLSNPENENQRLSNPDCEDECKKQRLSNSDCEENKDRNQGKIRAINFNGDTVDAALVKLSQRYILRWFDTHHEAMAKEQGYN